jgi:glyoxylase-like metal-dependent hydrolase (beta-lactamase superfamily II)
LAASADGSWTPEPPPEWLQEKVIIVYGKIGGYPVNGYILFDRQSHDAACIDTAYDPDKMLKALDGHRLYLQYVLLTHAHQDHMGGAERLKARTGASLCLHPQEMPLFSSQSRLKPDGFLEEGQELSIGKTRLKVLATPGHTPGGVTYVSKGLCFVGDALFAGSTGRSMSPQGYQTLLTSLRQKVLSLPEETVILPGHGPVTTVGNEKRHNPFF